MNGFLVLMFVLLNFFDAAITCDMIGAGKGEEGNPLPAFVFWAWGLAGLWSFKVQSTLVFIWAFGFFTPVDRRCVYLWGNSVLALVVLWNTILKFSV